MGGYQSLYEGGRVSTIDILAYTNAGLDYVALMRRSLEQFASGDNVLRWKCIGATPEPKVPDDWEMIATAPYHPQTSLCHGRALNAGIRALRGRQADYVIVVDIDIVVLYEGWDRRILSALQAVEFYGLEPPTEMHRSRQGFPCVFLAAFRGEALNKYPLGFEPTLVPHSESVARLKLNTPELARFYDRPIGAQIKCDTGWKLPWITYPAKSAVVPYHPVKDMAGKLLPYVDAENKRFCLKKPTHMSEWHLDGKLFATHKQACRSHPLSGEWGQAWKQRIDLYCEQQGWGKL